MFLMNIKSNFNYKLFAEYLKANTIGSDIKIFDSLDSTNKEAWKMNLDSIKNGTIIMTSNQTDGIGRRGNKWFSSQNKSLTFSIIINKINIIHNISLLPLTIGVAIIDAIQSYANINCQLKWPNDIMLDQKKLGGILIESKKNKFVIGVGLNINTDYIEFDKSIKNKAISLKIFKNQKIIVEIILAQILNEIEKKMMSKNNLIINEWMNNCMHVNQNIEYHDSKSVIKGCFSGITDNGEAVIKINNTKKIISSGSLII